MSVELATERRVACLPDDHPLAARESLSVADVLPEPIIAAPGVPGPVAGLLDAHRLPVRPGAGGRARRGTLDAEMHLVSRGRRA